MGKYWSLNREVELNETQKQVILSGILGDGNLKRNGNNYYYRETHSRKEMEYCYWKFELLQPYISKSCFHKTDKRDGQMGFQTINSPTFREYKKLTIEEVIERLDKFGLLLFILDDGWLSKGHLVLSGGALTREQLELVVDKYNAEFDINCKIIGVKRLDISFCGCNEKLIPYFQEYIPNDLDVFQKKIQPILNKFKV